jgi:BirA family transcriptional regulator, biotin operon repressor / biotin---[acetyl-CoA-carboxylase] ligase
MNASNPSLIGKNMLHFDEIESTNVFAMDYIAKTNPPHGTCIIADFQTGGRGQIGSSWHSMAGLNLLCSYILYIPDLDVDANFFLNMVSSLALIDTMKNYQIDATIKWPNDIYIGDKKVAGILIQNNIRGSNIKSTVLGIGLNINQLDFEVYLPNPTSMSMETGLIYQVNDVSRQVSIDLKHYLTTLQNHDYKSLREAYLSNLFRFGQIASYESHILGQFEGRIIDLEVGGKLIVEINGSSTQGFDIKEIKYIF